MSDKYGIDDKTRFLVLYLDAQMSVTEIAKIISRRNSQTIYRWESLTKYGEDIRIKEKKKCAKRKKAVPEEIENKVIQMVKEHPEGVSMRKLAGRFGVSMNSIKNILVDKGYQYLRYDDTMVYKEEERMIRVEFCKKMLSDDGQLIYRTFFSDEMGIELGNTRKPRAWQIPTEKVRKKSVIGSVRLDCWGAISAQGATSLDVYNKALSGELYRQIITRHKAEMERLYPDGNFYFLQDNHPAHRMDEEWIIKEQKLKLIKTPRGSADLNIIEGLWAVMKERVTGDAPTNEKELRASLLKNWEILTKPDRLQPIFEALHSRYLECVEKGGKRIIG